MSLTLSHGPLSRAPADANFRIEGPAHRLFFENFPRRVRATFAAETVLDTRHGKLLHETGLLPQLYAPRQHVRFDLLKSTQHHTHCPFKGNAAYWSIRIAGRSAENAAWAYLEPLDTASWLRDYVAFYWNSLDAWFDEDEQVHGHLRDPYHRVDVRATTRHVRMVVGSEVVAETHRPKVLSETGLPNRFYIPPHEVRADLLVPSDKQTVCPYKGAATYHTLVVNGQHLQDAAWSYAEPLEAALKVRDHVCFDAGGVVTEIEGE
jgi:uncharacterized protein (DUF427 family)